MTKHELMGGKLHVYKRPNSRHWQCSTYLGGRNWRVSTKEESLSLAKEVAEDWYFGLRGKQKAGELKKGIPFERAAEMFIAEFEVSTRGQRSPSYVAGLTLVIRTHLIPFFKGRFIEDFNDGSGDEYRMHRIQTSRTGKPPARSTLHQETIALRHVFKMCHRKGWRSSVPNFSPAYGASGKVGHRAWFSPLEYRQLYTATRRRAKAPLKERWRWECEQLHDFVLFVGNTGLRPDEAWLLQYRDVKIVKDVPTGQTILEIEVRGKRGVGYCKSMPGAVRPFLRLRKRNNAVPTDLLFPGDQRELFNTILAEEGLKFDRDGNRRTAYSLRHTYICLRLTEGADIYQVAKNCRTSVEMIEKHYAVHLKHTLDAAAINVRRSRQVLGASRDKQKLPNDSVAH